MAVYDFTTPDGAPVRVETGVGKVTSVEHVEGRRNAQVRIAAAHLRQPVTGWVDTQGPVWPVVTWARDSGESVWYRVDLRRHRKATAPLDTPLSALGNMDKTRDLTRLEAPANAPADSTIALDPFADRHPGAPAAAPPTAAPANVNPPPVRADGWGDTSRRPSAPAPATATDGHPRPTSPQGTPRPGATPGPPTHQPTRDPRWLRPGMGGPIPGPRLSAGALDALRDVIEAVRGGADEAWRNDCCDAALAAGCTRDQVLWTLRGAEDGHDFDAIGGRPTPAPRDPARAAVDRARDPDGLSRPVAPGDVSEPGTAPGHPDRNLVGAHNGMSRRVSARGNVTADARPWDATNMDGSVNYGSYAATAVGELVTMAAAQRMTRLRNLHANDPDRYPLRTPTAVEVDSLARTLLTIADRIQVHLRGGGRPDRAGGSHKQARYALKEAVAVMPIPWGDNAAMARWVGEVEAYACVLCDVLVGIVLKHEPLREVEGDGGGGGDAGGPGAPHGQVPRTGPGSR